LSLFIFLGNYTRILHPADILQHITAINGRLCAIKTAHSVIVYNSSADKWETCP